MFVVLALVFALGFVVFGVGSGSTGISSALQNAFNFGGSNGPSISSLEGKVNKHPQNAADWRSLATAYEQKHRTSDAITALERYTALRPHDASALQELAAQYSSLADTYRTDAQNAELAAQAANPAGSYFTPPSTTPLGRAFSDTSVLKSPISAASEQASSDAATAAVQKFTTAEAQADSAYRRLAKLTPTDPSAQLQLGEAAQSANDAKTAIAAYRAFLKLAPHDPLAGQVRTLLKQLAPAKK
jgi:cytochrome c-type biogenesis protein CcmH/NrfG